MPRGSRDRWLRGKPATSTLLRPPFVRFQTLRNLAWVTLLGFHRAEVKEEEPRNPKNGEAAEDRGTRGKEKKRSSEEGLEGRIRSVGGQRRGNVVGRHTCAQVLHALFAFRVCARICKRKRGSASKLHGAQEEQRPQGRRISSSKVEKLQVEARSVNMMD